MPPDYRISLSLNKLTPTPLSRHRPPTSTRNRYSPCLHRHSIVDSRRRRGQLQYLVGWEGYGSKERSWADSSDILDPSLIKEFHRTHLNQPAPRPRGAPKEKEQKKEMFLGGRRGDSTMPAAVHSPPSTLNQRLRSYCYFWIQKL